MTTQDNTIDLDSKRNLVIYHLNRLLIIFLSTAALAFDGYQTPDIFYGVSIVLWLWLPQIEVLERKINKNIIKQFSIVFLTALMVIVIYIVLGEFSHLSQFLPNDKIWLLLAVIVMGLISLFFKIIIWLVINNPIQNIGKEYRNEGAIK